MLPQITDFDLARRGDKIEPLIHPMQPKEFRTSEVPLGIGWSYSADMWNFGTMVGFYAAGFVHFRLFTMIGMRTPRREYLFYQPRTKLCSPVQQCA